MSTLSRRRLLAGLPAVLAVPGGGTWPIGGVPPRLNDTKAPNGTFLPSSAIAMTVSTTLDNYERNQVVGTPTCPTMAGPITWSVSDPDGDLTGMPQFVFDAASGQVRSAFMLPGRRPVPLTVTLKATNGLVTCLARFPVPVADKAGPAVYVGTGMAAAHGAYSASAAGGAGATFGFDRLQDLLVAMCAGLFGAPLPRNLAGLNAQFHLEALGFYQNDNGSRDPGATGYPAHISLPGPFTFRAMDTAGDRPWMGGEHGTNNVSTGATVNAKAFFICGNGDATITGLRVSDVNGPGTPDTDISHGVSNIRKDDGTYGDFFVSENELTDGNNGIETGGGCSHSYIRNNIIRNVGTQYVSSGATHGMYLGTQAYVEVTGNVVYGVVNGHCIKIRAYSSLIDSNRLMEGPSGTCSSQIELPNGGLHTVTNNLLEKGPNQQNADMLSVLAGAGAPDRQTVIRTGGNTFINAGSKGDHSGAATCIYVNSVAAAADGSLPIVVDLGGNRCLLADGAVTTAANDPASSIVWTALTYAPVMSFADPTTTHTPATLPGARWYSYANQGDQEFPNMAGVQLIPDQEFLACPVNAPAGFLIGTFTPTGSPCWKNSDTFKQTGADIRVNPFADNGWASAASTAPPFYSFVTDAYAPAARFAWTRNGAKLELRVGAGGASGLKTAGIDIPKVRVTASNGTLLDWRVAVYMQAAA